MSTQATFLTIIGITAFFAALFIISTFVKSWPPKSRGIDHLSIFDAGWWDLFWIRSTLLHPVWRLLNDQREAIADLESIEHECVVPTIAQLIADGRFGNFESRLMRKLSELGRDREAVREFEIERSRRRSSRARGLQGAYVCLVTGLAILIVPDFGRDHMHWMWSSKRDNRSGYTSYLETWPQGRHADEASLRLEECVWGEAINKDNRVGYEEYLSLYSQGQHAPEAAERLETCLWRNAEAQLDSSDALDEYLTLYPQGKHALAAASAILRIDWKVARDANTVVSYESYLESHPGAPNAADARSRQAQLRTNNALFVSAVEESTPAALEKFLADYPGHVNESEARTALGAFEGQIADLVRDNIIDVRTTGSDITTVKLEYRSLRRHSVTVNIPVGTFFVSNTPSSQNMVTTEEANLHATADWSSTKVAVACANRPKKIPGPDDSFGIIASPQQEELKRLMPVLRDESSDANVRQAAVWIVTDNADYDDLGTLTVSQFGTGGTRAIREKEAAEAMRICERSGINIRTKAIWRDRTKLLQGLENGLVRRWLDLRNGEQIRNSVFLEFTPLKPTSPDTDEMVSRLVGKAWNEQGGIVESDRRNADLIVDVHYSVVSNEKGAKATSQESMGTSFVVHVCDNRHNCLVVTKLSFGTLYSEETVEGDLEFEMNGMGFISLARVPFIEGAGGVMYPTEETENGWVSDYRRPFVRDDGEPSSNLVVCDFGATQEVEIRDGDPSFRTELYETIRKAGWDTTMSNTAARVRIEIEWNKTIASGSYSFGGKPYFLEMTLRCHRLPNPTPILEKTVRAHPPLTFKSIPGLQATMRKRWRWELENSGLLDELVAKLSSLDAIRPASPESANVP